MVGAATLKISEQCEAKAFEKLLESDAGKSIAESMQPEWRTSSVTCMISRRADAFDMRGKSWAKGEARWRRARVRVGESRSSMYKHQKMMAET